MMLSKQFQQVPVSRLLHSSIPHEDLQHPDWRAEHEDAYATHGGSEGYLNHLAKDMRANGQQKPIDVHTMGGKYLVVDGQHRSEALRRSGLAHARINIVGSR